MNSFRIALPLCFCLSFLANAQTESFWSASTVPANTTGDDSSSVELGLRFSANVAGNITGSRVYCAVNSGGTHTVHLWNASGASLATATLPACTGWTAVNFPTPVVITAGSTYTISYHTTEYPWNTAFFTAAITDSNLTAPANAGVYAYGNSPSFPSSTWQSSNYWVDVLFTASTGTPTYSISGSISGVGGASIALSGTSSASTVANGSGAYSFANLSNGSYTVTPTLSGYTFSPSSQNVTVNGASVSVPQFTAMATTYTVSGTISGVGGASVALSGTSSASTVSNGSGAYSFANLSNGSYTVTPTLSGYTFSPTSRNVTVNGANVSVPQFTAVATTYTVSGTISGVGGASVALSGTSSASTVASGSGAYSFAGLSNGSYTVTPTLSGYTFSPPSQNVTVNSANVTVPVFTAAAIGYSISGTISGIGSATVTLSGASSASTVANGSGAYSFAGLSNGSYTVTPTLSGYTFNPTSQSVTVNGGSSSGIDFTGQAAASGAISLDATVSKDGSAPSSTISSPLFSTVSPNELLLAFVSTDYASGANTTVTNLSGAGLTWALVIRTNVQSGTAEIWRAFATGPLSNVSVTANLSESVESSLTVMSFAGVDTTGTNGSGAIGAIGTGNSSKGAPSASITTSRNGSWVLGVGNDFDNALSRSLGAGQTLVHQDLAPVNDTYWVQRQTSPTPVSGTVVTINDTAPTTDRYNLSICEILAANGGSQTPTFSITGTISPSSAGSGATVTLTGTANTTTMANSSGNYTFTGLANGTYTVTPSLSSYTFSPANQTISIAGANATGVNFTGQKSTSSWSISGTIGSGGGATVTLSGASSATTTANGSGSYTFSGLVNGSYTVTPTSPGVSFTPTSQQVSVNGANVTGVNFNGATQTFNITGTISPTAGGGGATVTLSGAANAIITASPSGAYSFTGLSNGSYTVTPSNQGYSFNPPSQAVVINGSSASSINFTASGGYTITGTISPAVSAVGSTVTLTGPVNVTTTLTGSSTFTFGGLPAGSYTVTPTRTTATFTPSNQTVAITNANVTGVSFSATSTENAIFFDNFQQPSLSSNWTVISRHGEYAQSETECNIPQQVTSGNGLTITTAAQTWSCGDFNIDGSVRHAPSSWPYITGDVQWTSQNFTYGTVEVRAKIPAQATSLWPAIWMLGSNCQVTNIYTADVGYSTCSSLGNTGYVETDMVECYGGGWCQFHIANPSFGIGNGCDAVYQVDTNYHVFTTVWTATSVKQYMDGVLETTCNQSMGDPMFLIIQTQTGGAGGTPNNADLPAQLMVDYVKVTQP